MSLYNLNKTCKSLFDEGCAYSPLSLKVKEALHINWLKPDLNKQKEHVRGTRTLNSDT